LYILDTLLNLDAGTEARGGDHDNDSYSDMVFGVFAILDYRFAPRSPIYANQRYSRAPLADPLPAGVDLSPVQREIGDYGPLEPIARNTINVAKIAAQWPDMLRVAGSLVTHQVRAYDQPRMLTAHESRHRLGRRICHGNRGQIRQAHREGQEDQLAADGAATATRSERTRRQIRR
jgi:TnpA family transposase